MIFVAEAPDNDGRLDKTVEQEDAFERSGLTMTINVQHEMAVTARVDNDGGPARPRRIATIEAVTGRVA